MRTHHIAAVVAIAATILTGIVWKGVPSYIKGRVEREVPGCHVSSVSLHPWHIDLHAVQVERTGLYADLPIVRVNLDGSIHVVGGHVSFSGGTVRDGSRHRRVTFEALDVTGTWKGMDVRLHNVSGSADGDITAESATTTKPVTATARNVSRLTSGTIRATSVEILDFPKLPTDPCSVISLEDVEYLSSRGVGKASVVTCGGNRADGVVVSKSDVGYHAEANSVIVSHPWLHTAPLVFDYPMSFDWEDGMLKVHVGRPEANLHIFLDVDDMAVDILGDCSEIPMRLPSDLAGPFSGMAFTGSFDLHVGIGRQPEVKLRANCRARCSSPRLMGLFGRFTYQPYDANWNRIDRVTGPGSSEWVPLPLISPAMTTAVIALEDPGFRSHRGWINQALHNSLLLDLASGKFQRGGSTITMQVAKNIWLSRDKTLGRKAQEILLAMALEGCLTKDQILELYLNVVEYGPNLYGIGPASRHWFGISPMELTPRQAFWLASISTKAKVRDQA
jgi:hypothetical protein